MQLANDLESGARRENGHNYFEKKSPNIFARICNCFSPSSSSDGRRAYRVSGSADKLGRPEISPPRKSTSGFPPPYDSRAAEIREHDESFTVTGYSLSHARLVRLSTFSNIYAQKYLSYHLIYKF